MENSQKLQPGNINNDPPPSYRQTVEAEQKNTNITVQGGYLFPRSVQGDNLTPRQDMTMKVMREQQWGNINNDSLPSYSQAVQFDMQNPNQTMQGFHLLPRSVKGVHLSPRQLLDRQDLGDDGAELLYNQTTQCEQQNQIETVRSVHLSTQFNARNPSVTLAAAVSLPTEPGPTTEKKKMNIGIVMLSFYVLFLCGCIVLFFIIIMVSIVLKLS